MAVPIASYVDNRSPEEEEEEDEDGLPPITFLPRTARTQIQRSINNTGGTHDSVSLPANPRPDHSVVQLSSPITEQQRRPPIYVVEEEGCFISL